MKLRLDLSGKRFGRLVALSPRATGKDTMWTCVCDCGARTEVRATLLNRGLATACGCIRDEVRGLNFRSHGMTGSAEHKAWKGMRQRCNDPSLVGYSRYGGRGIRVCDRWNSFEKFFADMGPKPSPKHSIDRIDNDGDYELGNCRWATQREQSRNTSRTVMISFNGKTQCLADWASEIGISAAVISERIAQGQSGAEAVSVGRKRKRCAPLSREAVLEVRRLKGTGMTHSKVSALTGVSAASVSRITTGVRWASVQPESAETIAPIGGAL